MIFFNKNKVSFEIYDYIEKNLPDIDNKLQLALSIYYLLAKVFEYSPLFVLFDNFGKFKKINKVDLTNNKIICNQWSLIYLSILNSYGIEARRVVDGVHHFVRFNIDGVDYNADATLYGGSLEKYCLSDFANVRFCFPISGISLSPTNFNMTKSDYYNYKENLDKQIEFVYDTFYSKLIDCDRICTLVQYAKNNVKRNSFDNLLDDVFYRISLINRFVKLNIDGGSFERFLLLKRYIGVMFDDFSVNNLGFVKLFDSCDYNKIYCLFSVCIDYQYYYFVEDGKGFEFVDKNRLLDVLINRGFNLKRSGSIPGFRSSVPEIKKLKKTY